MENKLSLWNRHGLECQLKPYPKVFTCFNFY